MRQRDLRAIRVWQAQRKRAQVSEQALGRIIEQAQAWGLKRVKCGPDEIPWDVPGNPHRDALTQAIQERGFCLIRLAQGCRRVARIAQGQGQSADPLLKLARWCERFAWQGGKHDKRTRWARAGRLAETAEEPDALEALFEHDQFRAELDAATIIADRLEASAPPGASRPVQAGAAFKAMMVSDPATKAAWERARAKLQAFGKAMQEAMNGPEYRAAREAERRKWQDLADAIRERVEAAGDSLAAQHLPRPDSIEDWEHLARIVEIPDETIRSGKLTAREIHACALAWADRQKIKAKLSASAHAPAPAPGATYTIAAVLELAGVSDTTLNRYAKLAGIKTPQRGKRNHRYSADEVRAMLQAIIDNTSDRAMKERCREALAKL